MTRVQIPAYTDRWMMGDRYGEIVKLTRKKLRVNNSVRASLLTLDRFDTHREIAHVKLDKSGKVMRFILGDCTEV